MSWISSLIPGTGSWTPVIGGSGGSSGQVYGIQFGRFVKLGPLVFIKCSVTLTNKGTITGNVEIQGLPFTTETDSSATFNAPLIWHDLATNWVNLTGYVTPNSKVLNIVGISAAGPSIIGSNLVDADITNTTSFGFTGFYVAA